MSDVTGFGLLFLCVGFILLQKGSISAVPARTTPYQVQSPVELHSPSYSTNDVTTDSLQITTDSLYINRTLDTSSYGTDVLTSTEPDVTDESVDSTTPPVDEQTTEDTTEDTTHGRSAAETSTEALMTSTVPEDTETTVEAKTTKGLDSHETTPTNGSFSSELETTNPSASDATSAFTVNLIEPSRTSPSLSTRITSTSPPPLPSPESSPESTYPLEPKPEESDNSTSAPSSYSVILVFKGCLQEKEIFKNAVIADLSRKMDDFSATMGNKGGKYEVYIFNVNAVGGPDNRTITTEASVVEYSVNSTEKRIVPPSEILSALNMKPSGKIFVTQNGGLDFICAYPSKDEPCTDLTRHVDKTIIHGGLFEHNKLLFIAIFVVASLGLVLITIGLIYIRCRQRRCSTYVTQEKARLAQSTECIGVNNPLTDSDILREEFETSLNQNGAPPIKAEEGWIIPLDQVPERRNSKTEDTKL
ncbi:papilin isoform X2 [Patella vulgata]|uniref:papilin isoform X2 n=1 Tax=Patella vulgata TaxID=6465 RepID=UPI00217F9F89|nr:papilin isoform X2 [Patella vulgata]